MSKDNFIEITINSIKYIFIDTYNYKSELIFHFGSLNDEIFCRKINEDYIPIEDSFEIDIIKNKFGLINYKYFPDLIANSTSRIKTIMKLMKNSTSIALFHPLRNVIYRLAGNIPLTQEESNKIREEQIANFKALEERLGIRVDLDKINEKINSVGLYKTKGGLLKMFNWAGLYHPATNSILLTEDSLNGDSIKNKSTRLHEFIHAMSGPFKSIGNMLISHGLLEGQTENLAQSFFDNNTSSIKSFSIKEKEYAFQQNFPIKTKYPLMVTLIKQMEYSIGKTSYESILNGNLSFENIFSETYGKKLLTLLRHRISRLFRETHGFFSISKMLKRPFDDIQYLMDTQNILMKEVFNQDFEKIKTIEDAKKFFEKLKNFETFRTKVAIREKNGDVIHDNSYQRYYEEKLEEITQLLEKNGVDKQTIDTELLKKYQYTPQEFKPTLTKEDQFEYMKKRIAKFLTDKIINENRPINFSEYEYNYSSIDDKTNIYFIVKKETNEQYHFFGSKQPNFPKESVHDTPDNRLIQEELWLQNFKNNTMQLQNLEITSYDMKEAVIEQLKSVAYDKQQALLAIKRSKDKKYTTSINIIENDAKKISEIETQITYIASILKQYQINPYDLNEKSPTSNTSSRKNHNILILSEDSKKNALEDVSNSGISIYNLKRVTSYFKKKFSEWQSGISFNKKQTENNSKEK